MNKFFESSADFFSSAVRSLKGPSVVDRFQKRVDEKDRDGDARLGNCRIVVSVDQQSVPLEDVLYTLIICDKKTNEQLHQSKKNWQELEAGYSFLKHTFPRLDIPPHPPKPSSRSNSTLVIEERRKFVQNFLNTGIAYQNAGQLKEVQQLTGWLDYLAARRAEQTTMEASPEQLQRLESVAMGHSQSGHSEVSSPAFAKPSEIVAKRMKEQEPAPAAPAAPTRSRTSTMTMSSSALSERERQSIDEAFRLMDVDNLGAITIEEMQDFLDVLPKSTSRKSVEDTLDEVDKVGSFNLTTFRTVVTRLAHLSRMSVSDIMDAYKEQKLSVLYTAVGGGKEDVVDRMELRSLMHVLRKSGIQNLSLGDVESFPEDKTVPFSFVDFTEAVALLGELIPFDQLIKATMPSQRNNKIVQLVSHCASRSKPQKILSLNERLAKVTGSKKKCPNCDKMAVEMQDLTEKLAAGERYLQELQNKILKLERQQNEKDEQIKDLLESHMDKDNTIRDLKETTKGLQTQLEASLAAEEELQTRVCEAEAELDLEREKGSAWTSDSDRSDEEDGNNLGARCNLYFLTPAHLGSHEKAPVIDMPGSLLYTLREPLRPMGFTLDLYVCEATGCEYMACRDAGDLRSLAWTIENACLSFPWATPTQHRIPLQRWTRLTFRCHWEQHVFDVVLDEKVVESKLPMRDSGVEDVMSVDIYPRDTALVCYANIHFFR